jgi:hypothetical protein
MTLLTGSPQLEEDNRLVPEGISEYKSLKERTNLFRLRKRPPSLLMTLSTEGRQRRWTMSCWPQFEACPGEAILEVGLAYDQTGP